MQYRVIGETGISSSILGFGCMRFPILEDDSSKINEIEAEKMLKFAIDSGVTYIDTAYPYHGGNSERFVGRALQGGYREKVTLVTKSPSWLMEKHEDFERYLDEQLENLQTSYVDIYLLHALNKKFWEKYKAIDVFKAIEAAKAKGKIKNIGFSFHDDYELFEEIINAYPWDLCMIQLNYMDEEEQAGIKGLRYAEEKEIPVIIMEPLKGGMLSNPPEVIQKIWESGEREWSPVEWSMRYLANEKNIKVILSGMSTMEQVKENIEISSKLSSACLNESDQLTIEKVRQAYLERIKVKCTQCEYCMPCPQGVNIPRAFTLFNEAFVYDAKDAKRKQYAQFVPQEARASRCVQCGICEPKCPQKISIMEELEKVKGTLE